RGADGGAGVPQGAAQDPVDARVQEPDDPGDAARGVDPRRDARSGGALRREGVWTGPAAARDPRGGERAVRRPRDPHRRDPDHARESGGGAGGTAARPAHAGAEVSRDRRGAPARAGRSRRRSPGGAAMMRLPPFRYVAPRSAGEAARLLADHGPQAMAVAGGTDLFPNMK